MSRPVPPRIARVAMTVLTSLWASVQGNPVFMRRVNGWLTMFWIVMIPVSFLTGWIASVQYVSMLSLWALVSGHWSAWQAARVEVKQEDEVQHREAHPIEDRVVAKLVRDTDIRPSAGTNRSDLGHIDELEPAT